MLKLTASLPLILVLSIESSYSQQRVLSDGRYEVTAQVQGVDTVPCIFLQPVTVVAYLTQAESLKIRQNATLRRNITRVLPYAKLASVMLNDLDQGLKTLPEGRERRRYIKEFERKLRDNFETELKALTHEQGRLLMKLVDRETTATTYVIVKQFRGTIQAVLWQGLARLFGSSLKLEYNATGEDREIEYILRTLERADG